MRVYRAYPQHGAGLGNIIGSLFRAARPFLAAGVRNLLPVAARFGSNLLADVSKGKNIRRSAKRHAKKAGWEAMGAVADTIRKGQRGRGGRRGHIKQRRRMKRAHSPDDILSSNSIGHVW